MVRDGDVVPLTYRNVAGLTVTGGDGAAGDHFDVAPSAATAFTLNGDEPTPPASPGDTLNGEPAGTQGAALADTSDPAAGFTGNWSFSNRQAVSFTGMETLMPTAHLVVTKTAPAGPATAGNGDGADAAASPGPAAPAT